MGTLEQFAIWAFSSLHFDVALNWDSSRPFALVCQLEEVEGGVWVIWLRNSPALVLDSSLISLIGIGGSEGPLRAARSLWSQCGDVTGSEEQSSPNDWVVFFSTLCSLGPQDPGRSILVFSLMAWCFVFVYMVCDFSSISCSHSLLL